MNKQEYEDIDIYTYIKKASSEKSINQCFFLTKPS